MRIAILVEGKTETAFNADFRKRIIINLLQHTVRFPKGIAGFLALKVDFFSSRLRQPAFFRRYLFLCNWHSLSTRRP